jgi:hypothetical protein
MKITNATKFNRKSWIAEWRDLRFLFGYSAGDSRVSAGFAALSG